MPPRVLVMADPQALAAEFALLAGLEPVAWVGEGLVVAPLAGGRDASDQAARLAAVSLPWRADDGPAPPLPFPADVGGGVYRRSPGHAPAPPGVPEVVLVDGEGFGLAGHVTTGMCLDLLGEMPDGPALDAGCGSGILGLAWARLGRGSVLAVDLDPHAVTQARESAWASGLDGLVTVRRAALNLLPHDDLDDHVVLANAPRMAQDALRAVPGDPLPIAMLISGLQADDMDAVVDAWGERGLALARRESVGRWHAAALRAP